MGFDLTKQNVKYGNGYKLEFGESEWQEGESNVTVTTSLNQCFAASALLIEKANSDCTISCDLVIAKGALTIVRSCPDYNPSDNPDDPLGTDLKFSYIFLGY